VRDDILDRAIDLFNERGIEYVGIRELAKDLGIKGGNITYYFPTKDDLVLAVALRLRERNDATIRLPEQPSFAAYVEMLQQAFRNHWTFRCLFMSMPNLLAHNPKLAAGYIGAKESERRRVVRDFLEALRADGSIRPDVDDAALDRAVSFISLVSRSWIGDASISFRNRSAAWSMQHYLQIIMDFLAGIATAKGRRDLARVHLDA
jgi:AcrR family transcriptional regulator